MFEQVQIIHDKGEPKFALIPFDEFNQLKSLLSSVDEIEDYLDYLHARNVKERTERTYTLHEVEQLLRVGSASTDDDLTRIWGIGAKYASILHENGIDSFRDLANTTIDTLREMLNQGAFRFMKESVVATWPAQARLAEHNKWEELMRVQAKILPEQMSGNKLPDISNLSDENLALFKEYLESAL